MHSRNAINTSYNQFGSNYCLQQETLMVGLWQFRYSDIEAVMVAVVNNYGQITKILANHTHLQPPLSCDTTYVSFIQCNSCSGISIMPNNTVNTLQDSLESPLLSTDVYKSYWTEHSSNDSSAEVQGAAVTT